MTKSRATNTAVDTPDPADGPGHRLAAERQSRNIDIERVAALLHLRRKVVEALEEDRYEQLPDPVFVAGYIRNYARLLGIDSTPLVDAYRSRVPDSAPTTALFTPPTDREQEPGTGGGLLVRIAAVAALGVAVGSAALWWQGQQANPGSEPGVATTDVGSDQAASAATTGSGTGGSTASPATDAQVTAEADSQPAAPATPATPAPPASPMPPTPTAPAETATADEDFGPSSTATAAPTGAGQVELEFTGASWIDVRGADGKLVLNGEMRAGDRRVLSGQPPFKLVIGNSAATRMTVDGQPFDLQSRARGNVARFTFDPSAPR